MAFLLSCIGKTVLEFNKNNCSYIAKHHYHNEFFFSQKYCSFPETKFCKVMFCMRVHSVLYNTEQETPDYTRADY